MNEIMGSMTVKDKQEARDTMGQLTGMVENVAKNLTQLAMTPVLIVVRRRSDRSNAWRRGWSC